MNREYLATLKRQAPHQAAESLGINYEQNTKVAILASIMAIEFWAGHYSRDSEVKQLYETIERLTKETNELKLALPSFEQWWL
jgi:hypothetical protein